LAIGDRNPPPPHPRPHWRLKDTAQEAKAYYNEMSVAFNDIFQQSGKYDKSLEEMKRSISTLRDELRKRTLQVEDQLDKTRSKVRRLENVLEQTNVGFYFHKTLGLNL
jgi:ferritin-like metal-binding protein YciE